MRRFIDVFLFLTVCITLQWLYSPAFAEQIYVSKSKTGKLVYSNSPSSNQGDEKSQLLMVLTDRSSGAASIRYDRQDVAVNGRALPLRRVPIDPVVRSLVHQAARRHAIDPDLLFALIKQESGFNPMAVSSAGARGLMQLMPQTATRYGVARIHDPGENIAAGSAYLRDLLDMFGGLDLALAAYNAGEGAVLKYGKRIPPYRETQGYVESVLSEYRRLRQLR